ncbi:MAG: ArnT family glycosyltransferase [Acidimicrobiales bacterium]
MVTAVGLSAYAALTAVYVGLGLPNADEGFYLYASRLVYEGQLPWRDFAFTQMPLLPYVYGLPQLVLGPGLALGRVTSALFSVASVLLLVWTARRYAGPRAGAVVAVLLASYPYGIYGFTVAKSYALLIFLIAATMATLASGLRPTVRYPTALALAVAAGMVRLSAMAFAAVIAVYCVTAVRGARARLAVVSTALALVAVNAAFIVPAGDAAAYNLVAYHAGTWDAATLGAKLRAIVTERIPTGVDFFLPHWVLLLVAVGAALALPELRHLVRRRPELAVSTLGLGLFVAAHLGSGEWQLHWLTPAIPGLVTLSAIGLTRAAATSPHLWAVVASLVGAVTLVVPVSQGYIPLLDRSGGQGPIDKLQDVGDFVAAHTAPEEEVLALESQLVAVAADRPMVPGVSMAQFSYQDVTAPEAEEYHLVNGDLVLRYLDQARPRAVVLSDWDWTLLSRAGTLSRRARDPAPAREALQANYRLAYTKDHVGQGRATVSVYLPKDR